MVIVRVHSEVVYNIGNEMLERAVEGQVRRLFINPVGYAMDFLDSANREMNEV